MGGSERRVSVVKPETPGVRTVPIPLKAESLQRPQPGYTNFNKRMGVEDLSGNGGRPRSLEFGEGVEALPQKSAEEEKSRKKRSPTDANGNRILSIVKRETEEEA